MFVRQQEVVLVVLPVGLRISDSGNSSKFEVSSMLLISIDIAAGLSLPRTDRPKITMVSNHVHHNESSVSPQRDPAVIREDCPLGGSVCFL